MTQVSGVVKGVYSKSVNTKFGPKNTYDVLLDDGNYYKAGFKKPAMEVGDSVTIEYEVGKYGNEIKNYSSGTATALKTGSPTNTPASPHQFTKNSNHKPFPVPTDHGDRAIIRQNALTNARELVTAVVGRKADTNPTSLWEGTQKQIDTWADEVIRIAYKFEEYSSGDREVKAADEIINKTKTVKASKNKKPDTEESDGE